MKAVLFDLDDTLLDYSCEPACWRESAAKVAGSAGLELGRLVDALAESREWFWSDPEPHRRERTDMLGAWRKIAEDALARARWAPGAGFAAGLAEDFAARRRAAWRLFPEALDVLRRLRERSTRLALVTNGDLRHQRDKVERHGLGAFFDVILIEVELGVGKPDPVV